MSDSNKKNRVLGRGLDSILQSPETDITSKDISGDYVAGAVAEIDINLIETNPFQPGRTSTKKHSGSWHSPSRSKGSSNP